VRSFLCYAMRRWMSVFSAVMLFVSLAPPAYLTTATAPTTHVDRMAAAPDPDAVPRFEPTKCGFTLAKDQREGKDVSCGYAVVPLHHADPAGPMIRLAVARFRGTGETAAAEPIFYLEGGPGGVALGDATATRAARFTAAHDFMIFDQRGVGQSQPALNCPEALTQYRLDAILPQGVAEDDAHFTDALARCHDRLARTYDLTAFTTTENAADVNDIRAVLGYDQIELLGTSYGTRLALAVMRDFPGIVRSAVIDGVSPAGVDQFGESVVSADRAFALLFAACANDAACGAAFPTLAADFTQVVADLDARPLPIPKRTTTSGNGAGGSPALVLTGARLVQYIEEYLYSATSTRYLPLLIAQLKNRDFSLLQALDPVSSADTGIALGMHFSVVCSDYLSFSSRENATAAAARALPQIRATFLPGELTGFDVCARWGSPPNPTENQPVTSDIPTLVLASANDPVTPPAFARLAARTLSHGIYLETTGIGHTVTGNTGKCGAKIALAFYAHPDVAPDAGCVSTFTRRFLTNTKRYAQPPPFTIDPAKHYTATMVTTKGTITIDLFADIAPQEVNNIAFLAGEHFYDNMDFYGIAPGFGIGIGNPTGRGTEGPGYTTKADPIPATLNYERGVLAMVSNNPSVNDSRFVIISDDLRKTLEKKYTIIGRVTSGMDVVDAILAWQDGDRFESRPMVLTMTVHAS